MILQSLCQLYERLKDDPDYQIVEPGFSMQRISFKVVLKPNGELFEIQDARQVVDGKKVNAQLKVLGNAKPPGSGLNPCTLWDNSTYMLGYKKDDEKPERTLAAFEKFKERHLELKEEINCDAFDAVCAFLENWRPESILDENGEVICPALEDTGFGVFQILGSTEFVHENEAIVRWWKKRLMDGTGEDSVTAQCLLTGEYASIARLQPKIKGIAGGQSSGVSIVAFNEDAYESYSKKQAYNAPVSEDAAFRYGVALNSMLDGPMKRKHRMHLGDATVLFWTEKPTSAENVLAQFVSNGFVEEKSADVQDETLRKELASFVKSLRKGAESPDLDEAQTAFFLLALAPNAARTSVRFFHRSNIADLREKLSSHFEDISIERRFKENSKHPDSVYPAFWQLLSQTARESKEVPPLLGGALLRSVILGVDYPQGLYSAVIRRLKAGDGVSYLKACVIKGYLNRNLNKEVSMSLDKNRREPAYLLGRLFAVLEKTQSEALGSVNAGLREKFYSSASATPASVFPRILRTHQHHLAKLQGGRKVNMEKLLQEILGSMSDFPKFLNLNDQGLFAIGYYHQNLDFYTKNEDKNNNEEE